MSVNSIDSDQYVDGSIDTVHIADGAVTSAKLDTNIAIAGTLTLTGAVAVTPPSGTASIAFTSAGAGSEVFSINGQIPGVSNTGFAIRNVTDSRNDLTIDANGVIAAASLDISGDIDVDGTTNLDVVDIDGAVDMASTLTVGTKIFTGGMTLTNNDSGRIGLNRNPDTGDYVNSASFERHQINGAFSGGDYLDFQNYNSSGAYVGGFRLDDGALITVPTAGKHAVFNENGIDADFRVESDVNDHALWMEGSTGSVSFGKATTSASTQGFTIIAGAGGVTSSLDSLAVNTYHVYRSGPTDGGYKFYVNTNGGIKNFSANNVNLSDRREKKNIEELGSQWDVLKQWSLKKFHYNADDDAENKKYGVIAQEVEIHNPEVIGEFNIDDDNTRMAVKEQQMMWMAIKALQEAQTRIETLETRLETLENA
jgi:hypothetical protein